MLEENIDASEDPELKEIFTRCVEGIYPGFNADEVTVVAKKWEPGAMEAIESAQAMAYTGNIVESGSQVTIAFNDTQDHETIKALQVAIKDTTRIHVSYSSSDITIHARPETVISRLSEDRVQARLKRELKLG